MKPCVCLLLASLGLFGCSVTTTSNGAEPGPTAPGDPNDPNRPADPNDPNDPNVPPPPPDVKIGPEAKLASGAVGVLGAQGDKVLYVVFSVGTSNYRIELAKSTGGNPKVLHQGSLPRAVQASDLPSGDTGSVMRLWFGRTPSKKGNTIALAIPAEGTSSVTRDLVWVDLDAESFTKFDTVTLDGPMVERDGVLFYWHAETARELSWRLPNGSIVDGGQAIAGASRERSVAVSPDGSKIAFLSLKVQTGQVRVVSANGSAPMDVQQFPGAATNNCQPQVDFSGNTLVFSDCMTELLQPMRPRVSVWSGSGTPKAIYTSPEPPPQTYDDKSIERWWVTNGLVAIWDRPYNAFGGQGRTVMVTDVNGVGSQVEADVVRSSGDGRFVAFQPKGSMTVRVAEVKAPFPAGFLFSVQTRPAGFGLAESGRWVAAGRSGGGFDTLFVGEKEVPVSAKDFVAGYELHELGSGKGACWSSYQSFGCVDEAGAIRTTTHTGGETLAFVRAVGANGLLYAKPGGEVAVALAAKDAVAWTSLTATSLDTHATASAAFYVVPNGTTATLVGRSLR